MHTDALRYGPRLWMFVNQSKCVQWPLVGTMDSPGWHTGSFQASIVILQCAWGARLLASKQQVDETVSRYLCTGCAEYAGSQGEAL